MKKWIFIVLGYIILVGALAIVLKNRNSFEDKWKTATANVKAYDDLLSSSRNKNAAYQLTIDQLNYSNDSVLQELNDTRRQLKVKDKNLKSVQYVTSTVEKTDTITLKDTIFNDRINIDTVLQDNWYSLKLKLQYPDTIIVSPSFRSEKNIITSTKKETVNPPKKFWLFRLFQRKHRVLQVDVIEKNPYAVDGESRYVEIIK